MSELGIENARRPEDSSIGSAAPVGMALGAAGNLVVVVTWMVSRTVGLPLGEYAGIRLPVGFPDTLATVLALLLVAGAVALMAGGWGPARSAARSPRFAVAAAAVAGALTLAAVLSQADAFGSSAGSGQHGTGGVSGSYGSGGAGGTSGGGTSGNGYSGAGY